jgi:hypothetical protein
MGILSLLAITPQGHVMKKCPNEESLFIEDS